jgi:hypothetical protein
MEDHRFMAYLEGIPVYPIFRHTMTQPRSWQCNMGGTLAMFTNGDVALPLWFWLFGFQSHNYTQTWRFFQQEEMVHLSLYIWYMYYIILVSHPQDPMDYHYVPPEKWSLGVEPWPFLEKPPPRGTLHRYSRNMNITYTPWRSTGPGGATAKSRQLGAFFRCWLGVVRVS